MRVAVMSMILVAVALPLAAEEAQITISQADCRRLVNYVPAAGVAYQPGVDVHGHAVAGADLPGSGNDIAKSMLPQSFEFPITINPATYGAAKVANAAVAKAAAGQVSAYNTGQAASAKVTALTATKTQLTAQQTALNATASTLATQQTQLQNNLATLQREVTAGTLSKNSPTVLWAQEAVTANQAKITANNQQLAAVAQSLTSNASAIAAQQAIVSAAPANETAYSMQQTQAQGQVAALSSKGLDNTRMDVGTVHFDLASNTLTFNGKPLGGDTEAAIAAECRKRGVH